MQSHRTELQGILTFMGQEEEDGGKSEFVPEDTEET